MGGVFGEKQCIRREASVQLSFSGDLSSGGILIDQEQNAICHHMCYTIYTLKNVFF